MAALLARDEGVSLQGWLGDTGERRQRGMQAYQANACASAERALASSFPTVQALMGVESFAAMARAFWHAQPPVRGDLACFGEGLPAFIADSEQLADVPCLADSARLDWLLSAAERAADDTTDVATLKLLAEVDPPLLRLELMPGVAVLASHHPVVSIWRAHQPGEDAAQQWLQARGAAAAGKGETAVVWRSGWRAQALALSDDSARWMQCLLQGATLAAALDGAGEGFAFETWLVLALQHGWLARAWLAD